MNEEASIRKGDLVRIHDSVLKRYDITPPRKHADFYGLRKLTVPEINEWYSKHGGLGSDGEPRIAPRTRTVILDTDGVYIVSRARVRCPEGQRTTGWCEVIDPRKGLLLNVKRSYLQTFKENGE